MSNYKERYINRQKTKEIFADDPNISMWGGASEEELNAIGWFRSDEPLALSEEDCPLCEGGKAVSTLKSPTLHIKCQACDGTGKKLIYLSSVRRLPP